MEKELQELLNNMDVPSFRKSDLRWLSRNLAVRNSSHPDFQKAMELIVSLLRDQNKIKSSEAKKILRGVDNSPVPA